MKMQELTRLCARVGCPRGPLPLTIELREPRLESDADNLEFLVRYQTRDRDTNEPQMIFMCDVIPGELLGAWDEERWLQYLYELARRAFLHELGEFWMVDGKRIKDPHADGAIETDAARLS